MQSQLSAREHRMTRTIGTICAAFLVCNLPAIIHKALDPRGTCLFLSHAFKVLFHVNYSFNFVIYAASSRQYREAYLLFLNDCILSCGKSDSLNKESSNQGGGRQQQNQVVYSAGRRIPYDSNTPPPLPQSDGLGT